MFNRYKNLKLIQELDPKQDRLFVEMENGDSTAVLTIPDVTERKPMEEALISAN